MSFLSRVFAWDKLQQESIHLVSCATCLLDSRLHGKDTRGRWNAKDNPLEGSPP
ncbi:MAG: hypothetical protein HYZ33_03585 [Ignavibacteriales bacterium]|nr:hypothetical protein [Ignavibacteriales bacterium]